MNRSLGIYNIIDNIGINKSIKNVIESGINFNTYTSPKGLKDLRKEISNFLNRIWNYKIDYNRILLTSGSQQSLNLISTTLIKDGDVVLIEQPTYFGALDILKKKNIKLVGIELKENGFDMEELEEKIKKYLPKLIYVVPTFNNPTGYVWSNKKRRDFLKIINKYNILVIEDDPYSLINFTKNKYRSLYELNKGKNIFYLGTFSKLISPSINVGYIVYEKIEMLYLYKKSFDLCTNVFLQYVVLDYLRNNDLEKVVNKRIVLYKKVLKDSIEKLKNEYKDKIEFISKAKGGLFYLVKFKDEVNLDEFEDGSNYFIEGGHNNTTRINICFTI
jgi:2-aminoadipate transaminase